ncbi:hypothetical protein EV121DRAFT_274692 [Schizophyllum commune]
MNATALPTSLPIFEQPTLSLAQRTRGPATSTERAAANELRVVADHKREARSSTPSPTRFTWTGVQTPEAENALVARARLRHVTAVKTNSTGDLHLLRDNAASECGLHFVLEAINHQVVKPGMLPTERAAS